MSSISRVVPGLLVSSTVAILAFATASLVALENSRPEVLALPEQVSFLYVHVASITFGVVGALIIRSQPRHPVGWAFGLFALLIAADQVLVVYTQWHPEDETLARLYGAVGGLQFGLLALMLLLFPDGRPPTPRWRPVVALTCAAMALVALIEATGTTVPGAAQSTDEASTFVLPLAFVVLGAVSLWVRWRHATGETRQQVKWLALGATVFGTEFSLGFVMALTHSMSDDPGSYYIGNLIFVLTVCLIPAAMGIGIVRHHLYDVDKLLSRMIAYGLLLVAVTAFYLVSVAVFAALLASRSRAPTALAVATTGVAVVVLNPLRRRLVAWADRRVYGTRTEPAEVMAGVAAVLAAYRSPEDGVKGLAEAARRATRARGAVVLIELSDGSDHRVAAGDVSAAGARTSVPVRVDGADVGSITVVDPSRHSDGLALLARLAALAAPAASDMRTIAELRKLSSRIQVGNAELAASRARLAGAEKRERARLRRIVQSEVLPAVLDLRRGLPDLETVRTGDVSGMDMADAARRSRELADKIRSLAHDVLPPVLADRGLAAALRAHVRRLGADLTLAVPESHRLPEALEAALYVCGRILVDAVDTAAGPVALTLAISNEDVHLAMKAPTGSATVCESLHADAMRLLGDRIAVLGGGVTTSSLNQVTEVRCRVPFSSESDDARPLAPVAS